MWPLRQARILFLCRDSVTDSHIDMANFEEHLWAQFRDEVAQGELQALSPADYDWVDRTSKTLETLIPRLGDIAANLKNEVPSKLNSIQELLDHIALGSQHEVESLGKEYVEWREKLVLHAGRASSIIEQIESQQVSAEIQRQLVLPSMLGDIMYPNGNSIYPDLVMKSYDYSRLPVQSRKKAVIGPCLQGKQKRPSNVPDGCEIKTNRASRIRVDAHAPHPGLHLGITWGLSNKRIDINGVWAAYIRLADHKEASRNSETTTVKYSFGHDRFVSLL